MRILIIEDEVGISNFLKQGLEEESYAVEIANDGKTGLKMALSGEFDLLLLDWMLPGLNGIEVCERFRLEDQKTPVIFLTAKDTTDEAILGLQTGANDYIRKPFHFSELLERIRVQLRPATSINQTILTLGTILLDNGSHKVTKADKQVYLTPKEFSLLEFLMKNKGQVCTRTQIIQSVWDIHFEYNTSVIDVYINSLRNKLNLTEEENYIQTIRGIGYLADDK